MQKLLTLLVAFLMFSAGITQAQSIERPKLVVGIVVVSLRRLKRKVVVKAIKMG